MKRVLGLLLLASWMGCGSADNAENAANQVDPSVGVEENTTADALNEALGEDEDADQAKMLEGLAKALQEAEPEGILQDADGIDFGGGTAPAAEDAFAETGPSLSERLDGTLEQASDLGKKSLAGKGPLNAVLRAFTKAAGLTPPTTDETAAPEDGDGEVIVESESEEADEAP